MRGAEEEPAVAGAIQPVQWTGAQSRRPAGSFQTLPGVLEQIRRLVIGGGLHQRDVDVLAATGLQT